MLDSQFVNAVFRRTIHRIHAIVLPVHEGPEIKTKPKLPWNLVDLVDRRALILIINGYGLCSSFLGRFERWIRLAGLTALSCKVLHYPTNGLQQVSS